jgi:uncharacterized protein with von Willebrand factor type A (vWA) domain
LKTLDAFLFDAALKLSREKHIDIVEARKLAIENYRPQIQEGCLATTLKHNDMDAYAILQRIYFHPDKEVREASKKELLAHHEELKARAAKKQEEIEEKFGIKQDRGNKKAVHLYIINHFINYIRKFIRKLSHFLCDSTIVIVVA